MPEKQSMWDFIRTLEVLDELVEGTPANPSATQSEQDISGQSQTPEPDTQYKVFVLFYQEVRGILEFLIQKYIPKNNT